MRRGNNSTGKPGGSGSASSDDNHHNNQNTNVTASAGAPSPSPAGTDNQDMNDIGLNLGVGAGDLKKIHEKRLRKGECPSCGVKCFKVTGNHLLGRRRRFLPLTIAGHVKDGVCLTCHPAAQHTPTNQPAAAAAAAVRDGDHHHHQHREERHVQRTVSKSKQKQRDNDPDVHAPENFQIPQFILHPQDDNDTVASNITMDRHLWSLPGEEQFHNNPLPMSAETRWHGPTSRPEASFTAAAHDNNNNSTDNAVNAGGDDRPQMPRRKASGTSQQAPTRKASDLIMQREAAEKAALRAGGVLLRDVPTDDHGRDRAAEMSLVENAKEEEEDEAAVSEEEKEEEEEKVEVEEEMRRSMKMYRYPPPPPSAKAVHDPDSQEIYFDSSERNIMMDYPKEYHPTDGDSTLIEPNSPRGATHKGRVMMQNNNTNNNNNHRETQSHPEGRSTGQREIAVHPDTLMDALVTPSSLAPPTLPSRPLSSRRLESAAPRPPTRHISPDEENIVSSPKQQLRSTRRGQSLTNRSPRSSDEEEDDDDNQQEPPLRAHGARQSAGTMGAQYVPHSGRGATADMTKKLSTLSSLSSHNEEELPEPPLREQKPFPSVGSTGPRVPQHQQDPRSRPHPSSGGGGGYNQSPRMPIRKVSERQSSSTGTPPLPPPLHLDNMSVPSLLQALEESMDSASRVVVLERLKDALMDVESKRSFCSRKGLSNVNSTMWIDIADLELQQACSDLLLALVAKASKNEPDFLTGAEGQNVIDALLIAMQQLLDEEDLQQRGCRVLGCLARASGKNEAVSDGSLSGAVLTILNAMDAHRNSRGVMEWGVRTLYEFCTHSQSAETNKRHMWSQPLGSGEPGWSLLMHALNVVPEDAVGLLWVLSSNEDGLDQLKPAGDIITRLYRLLRRFQKDRQSSLLVEAALGCVSNFASVPGDPVSTVDATEICILALNLIPAHLRSSPSLCTEACAVVSNLASVANKTTIVEQGGVDDLSFAMTEFHRDEALHEEAVNALLALLKDSTHIKEAATTSTTFSTLLGLFRMHESSPKWQTTACQFFASIFAMDGMLATDLERGGLTALCDAMSMHPNYEKVQESACVALSNFSGRPDSASLLAASQAVELALAAMREFPRNLTIQIMTCIILWNMEYGSGEDVGKVDAVECIVKAVQNHIEAEKLLEVACGALLHLIYGSETHKKRVAKYGGVEAIACTLVMHSQSKSVLEKVCEVMASLSACPDLTNFIIEADCIGNMVEILRSSDSISVYRSAALFLKNVVVAEPTVCEEAAKGITTIVKAMQTHKTDPDLQREACNYLWSVAGTYNLAWSS